MFGAESQDDPQGTGFPFFFGQDSTLGTCVSLMFRRRFKDAGINFFDTFWGSLGQPGPAEPCETVSLSTISLSTL